MGDNERAYDAWMTLMAAPSEIMQDLPMRAEGGALYESATRLPEVEWRQLPTLPVPFWTRIARRFRAAVDAWRDAA